MMTTQIEDRKVNGINVDALHNTIAVVEADSAAAQTHWKVVSKWQGGNRSDHFVDGIEVGGHKLDRHLRIHMNANPQEYLLAATNACMMVGYATIAAVMGVELTKLELEIVGDIDLRGFLELEPDVPPGYERLHYTVRLAGNGTREQFEKMHEVVQRTSLNYYNMTHAIKMTSTLAVE